LLKLWIVHADAWQESCINHFFHECLESKNKQIEWGVIQLRCFIRVFLPVVYSLALSLFLSAYLISCFVSGLVKLELKAVPEGQLF